MKTQREWMAAILTLMTAGSMWGQQSRTDQIELCGVSLTVGMEQAPVMRSLTRECAARAVGVEGTMWDLTPKGKTSGSVGSVFFVSGKLDLVSKKWADGDSIDLAEGLYFAVRQFVSEGRKECTLDADQPDTPGFAVKRVTLRCGSKDIIVMQGRSKEMHSESVTENLH